MFHENIIKNDTNHTNYDTTMSQSYDTYLYHMHSQNSSFITLLRFEESSKSEVLVWQCNIKTMQNPTNNVDLCPSGQEVYFSQWREVTGSKPVGEECQDQLCSYCFAHFLIKIQKILDFFFFCFWVLTLYHEFKLNEQTCA